MSRLSNILHGVPLSPDEVLQEKLAEYGETATPVTAAPRRRSSGISTHRRSATPQKSEAQVEGDMYNLPLEEIRRRANEQLRD